MTENILRMKLIKIILLLLFGLSLNSCFFDVNFGYENGNGNLKTEERYVNQKFDEIIGSGGLEIYLTEGPINKIIVEADENLVEIIETKISNGILTVQTKKNIVRSKAKRVLITYKNLSVIKASSGAIIKGKSIVRNKILTLESSSGANIDMEVFAKELFTKTSSGANININGKATILYAKTSSGSELNAKDLKTINSNIKAHSGSKIMVTTQNKLEATASSGGNIQYYGNPNSVIKDDGSSGSIKKM